MAKQQSSGAPERADHPTPVPFARAVVQAVTVYETAAFHAAHLGNVALSGRMSDLDAESLAAAEDLMAGSRAALAAAGMLHLIEAA